jgi:hypothetical protein
MTLEPTNSIQRIASKPDTRLMSSFKVLALASNAHLLRVAKDSNIILGSEERTPIDVLDYFRAQEAA